MNVFYMFRGDDKIYELTVVDKQTESPVDITGCTIKMTWKEKKTDETYFLQKTFTLTDPANGKAEVTIDAADTSQLTERKEFFFDVEITKADGKKETLLEGKFIVLLDVTT